VPRPSPANQDDIRAAAKPFRTDAGHSGQEPRYAALGKTEDGRRLTVIFTVRGNLIRVISARDMSRRERRIYEQEAGSKN